MKIILPIIAAVLILGAIAIFAGMALNNHSNSGNDDNKVANEDSKDGKKNNDTSKDKDSKR